MRAPAKSVKEVEDVRRDTDATLKVALLASAGVAVVMVALFSTILFLHVPH